MWRFKQGSSKALARIYKKYEAHLLTLASGLLGDLNVAEDVVHDFFVSFAQSADRLKLDGNLKGYLATCVANRARDEIRARRRHPGGLEEAETVGSNVKQAEATVIFGEEMQALNQALSRLAYEQREVVMLHYYNGLKFKAIARIQDVSINTVQSRCRYGLEKLRQMLDGDLEL